MIEAAQNFVKIGNLTALVDGLLTVAILALAVSVVVKAHGGRFARIVEMLAVVGVAALVAGLATGQNFVTFGSDIYKFVFNG